MVKSYAKTTTKKGISKPSGSTKAKSGDYQKGRELPVQPKAELKASDLALTASVFKPTGGPPTFQYLNNVTNGAEIYQRTGRKIYMKSLHVKGFIEGSGTASANMAILRMVLVYDAQPNGAFPAIADLFQDSTAGGATGFMSELNLNNRERFKILREKMWVMGPTAANQAGQTVINDGSQCLVINEFIKLKKIEAIFNATNGGTVADVTSGSLFAVFMSDANSTSSAWNAVYTARLRYYD